MIENKAGIRLHGLDTLRAAVIIFIFAYHYMAVLAGRTLSDS
jgi:peptidoglycan/LPS O-acetylase OafA/YrhL